MKTSSKGKNIDEAAILLIGTFFAMFALLAVSIIAQMH
jgi:hypothetical protein